MSVKNPSAPFTVAATNSASSSEPTATWAPRDDHSVPFLASRTMTVTASPAASRSRATTAPTCPDTPATTNLDMGASSLLGTLSVLKMPGARPRFSELLGCLHLHVVGRLGDQL